MSLVRTAGHPQHLESRGTSQEMFPCLLLSVAFMEISRWLTKRKENMTWVLCGYGKFPQLQTPEQEWGTLERCPCPSGSSHYWAFTTDDGFFLCSHWKTLYCACENGLGCKAPRVPNKSMLLKKKPWALARFTVRRSSTILQYPQPWETAS